MVLVQGLSHLSNQLVSVNHCFSTTLPVLSGVPQGSILGPLLFLIYVNDLHLSASSCSLLLFADDTKCFNMVHSPSDSLVLQQDLTSLFNWSNHWKLSFNELKCILICFSASCPAVNVSSFLNQHQLSVTNSHKDLGSSYLQILTGLTLQNRWPPTKSLASYAVQLVIPTLPMQKTSSTSL